MTEQMTDHGTVSWIADLEQARAQLEIALSANVSWRGLGSARSRASRARHERALAGNPVYRAWDLLSRALDEIRADGGPAQAQAQAQVQTERGTAPRRISLREVLAGVRSDAALDSSAPPQAVVDRVPTAPPTPSPTPLAAAPRIAPADPEEAAVSFVVREPAPPPQSPHADEGPLRGPEEAGREAAPDPKDDPGSETEVVIVSRSG